MYQSLNINYTDNSLSYQLISARKNKRNSGIGWHFEMPNVCEKKIKKIII